MQMVCTPIAAGCPEFETAGCVVASAAAAVAGRVMHRVTSTATAVAAAVAAAEDIRLGLSRRHPLGGPGGLPLPTPTIATGWVMHGRVMHGPVPGTANVRGWTTWRLRLWRRQLAVPTALRCHRADLARLPKAVVRRRGAQPATRNPATPQTRQWSKRLQQILKPTNGDSFFLLPPPFFFPPFFPPALFFLSPDNTPESRRDAGTADWARC